MMRAHARWMTDCSHPPCLALVGDRSTSVEAQNRIPSLLAALVTDGTEPIEPYWLGSTDIDSERDVSGFDGIWVVPGSPYLNTSGVHVAIEAARTRGIPLLGTCAGFQHLLLEFARNVCGLTSVAHAETHPDAADLLLAPLACKLFGEEAMVIIEAGTTVARAMGAGPTTERYFCRFGFNQAYKGILVSHGLVISGRDPSGEVRVVELPDHPFFVGALFQPELSSDATLVHPLIARFAAAVRERAELAAAVR
jgi:CTP synthase (UTP-ammonia lyase)